MRSTPALICRSVRTCSIASCTCLRKVALCCLELQLVLQFLQPRLEWGRPALNSYQFLLQSILLALLLRQPCVETPYQRCNCRYLCSLYTGLSLMFSCSTIFESCSCWLCRSAMLAAHPLCVSSALFFQANGQATKPARTSILPCFAQLGLSEFRRCSDLGIGPGLEL